MKISNLWMNIFSLITILLLVSGGILISCGGGGGGGSSSSGGGNAPEDVTGLSALPGDGQVTLDWTGSINTSDDLAGYYIYQSMSVSGRAVGDRIGTAGAESTSFGPITGLTNDQSYTFMVTSFDTEGNESSGAGITVRPHPEAVISNTNFQAPGGLNGGAVSDSRQYITGILPMPPGGDGSSFQGSAFLLLNGNRIQLDVQQVSGSSLLGRSTSEAIVKGGKTYEIGGIKSDFSWILSEPRDEEETLWGFEVTFSVNAGPNTISFEVFDIQGTLYARSEQWKSIGAIEPKALEITLSWSTNLTDIDLHVSPDNGATHCYYNNMTAGDMVLDYDDINGYGPEHVTVDNVLGLKTYKIKVYYFADHHVDDEGNPIDPPTPTLSKVTANVNGSPTNIYPFNHTENDIGIRSATHTMTSASTVDAWSTGAHVWNVGEVTVQGAVRYDVTLGTLDLSNWPIVELPVTVLDPENNNEPVTTLTESDFYVINSGTLMEPVKLVSNQNGIYTLRYTDITAGKRDLYVYIYHEIKESRRLRSQPEDTVPVFAGGLSDTATYGNNYALLVGLNEYPPGICKVDSKQYKPGPVLVAEVTTQNPATNAAEFSAIYIDSTGGTYYPPVTTISTSISYIGTGGSLQYELEFAAPANYTDYDQVFIKFKKENWTKYCINNIEDLKTALLAKGVKHLPDGVNGHNESLDNTMWDTGQIYTLTNNSATKASIMARIDQIAAVMKNYDLFLFHFSGHGSGMPVDGDSAQFLRTYDDIIWISVTDLQTKLATIPHKSGCGIHNTIILLDCCHSGNFIGKDMSATMAEIVDNDQVMIQPLPFLPQSNRIDLPGVSFVRDIGDGNDHVFAVTAVTGEKEAFENIALLNGVFTYFLVEGINVGGIAVEKAKANASGLGNKDTWITGEEAFGYLDDKAQKWVDERIKPTYPNAEQKAQIHPGTNGKTRLIYCW